MINVYIHVLWISHVVVVANLQTEKNEIKLETWIDLSAEKEYYIPFRSEKGLLCNIDLQFPMFAKYPDCRRVY